MVTYSTWHHNPSGSELQTPWKSENHVITSDVSETWLWVNYRWQKSVACNLSMWSQWLFTHKKKKELSPIKTGLRPPQHELIQSLKSWRKQVEGKLPQWSERTHTLRPVSPNQEKTKRKQCVWCQELLGFVTNGSSEWTIAPSTLPRPKVLDWPSQSFDGGAEKRLPPIQTKWSWDGLLNRMWDFGPSIPIKTIEWVRIVLYLSDLVE